MELVDPEQPQEPEVDGRAGRYPERGGQDGLAGSRRADSTCNEPGDAGDRRGRNHRPRDGGRHPPPVDPVEVAVEHEERETRADEVGEGERERESGDAQPRVQRKRQHDVDDVLDAVDQERRARVEPRRERTQREEVQRERQQADRKRRQCVGNLDGVVRGERTALEERDDDGSRETEVERGRRRDHDRGEPQPPRELRSERDEISSRRDDREFGREGRCE